VIVNESGEDFWFKLDTDRSAITSYEFSVDVAAEGSDAAGNSAGGSVSYNQKTEYENQYAKAKFQKAKKNDKYSKAYIM